MEKKGWKFHALMENCNNGEEEEETLPCLLPCFEEEEEDREREGEEIIEKRGKSICLVTERVSADVYI